MYYRNACEDILQNHDLSQYDRWAQKYKLICDVNKFQICYAVIYIFAVHCVV